MLRSSIDDEQRAASAAASKSWVSTRTAKRSSASTARNRREECDFAGSRKQGRRLHVNLVDCGAHDVRTAESLLTFFTGVATPAGRVWRLRTRKPTAAGEWEVVECPCANLHIVGAANLGALPPPDAFWSRLRIIRLEFSEAAARATAEAILAGHSIGGTVTDFARRYVAAMKTTRAAMVTGQLQYAADFRLLERACRYAATPDVGAVAVVVKNEMRNTCPGWNPDTGDIRSEGKAAVETAINLL
jgi:hypothetical protein